MYQELDNVLAAFCTFDDSSWPSMKDICRKAKLEYSRTYEVRLLGEGMIEQLAGSFINARYRVTLAGENWLHVKGGYEERMILIKEESLNGI